MTGRALLNRLYVMCVDRLDPDKRADFDALMADPESAVADQQQRTLATLAAVGGEIG